MLIDGIQLDERNYWMNTDPLNTTEFKPAKGIILLVSVQNAEPRFQAWQKMIKALNPRPYKVIFCENDSIDNTVDLINNWDFPHELITFKSKASDVKKNIYAVIARNRQYLLERARQIKPKYAIYLDDDVFPGDQNFISKIIQHKVDLVGGVYLRPFEEGIMVASKWSVETPLSELPQAVDLDKLVSSAKKGGFKYLMFSSCNERLYKVAVTSAGCLCLNKKIIQDKRLNFFPLGSVINKEASSEDFSYCLLAKKLGYEIYLDGNTRLAHLFPGPDKIRPWIIR
jgi:hypothetical protein